MQAPVRAQPQLVTQISEQAASPGAKITDTVRVTGLGGQAATIQAALYGPYPSARRDQVRGRAGLDRHARRSPATAST